MNERQHFLDAIAADPKNFALKLIYADWLEEHGESEDDRADVELIRLEWKRDELHKELAAIDQRMRNLQIGKASRAIKPRVIGHGFTLRLPRHSAPVPRHPDAPG